MASTISICNLALGHLGADRIDALTEASSEARACNRFYGQTLDALLAAGPPWRFARHEVVLAEVAGVTASRWAHVHALPADLLRVREVRAVDDAAAGEGVIAYELLGDRLLSDLTPVSLRYIRRIDDPAKFTPLFVEALSWHLAARLAMPLTRDANQRQSAFQMALQAQAAASAAEGNDEPGATRLVTDYEAARL